MCQIKLWGLAKKILLFLIKKTINTPKKFAEVEKHTNYSAESITIKPKEGDLLINVGTNLSDEERVVVSFNIDIGY